MPPVHRRPDGAPAQIWWGRRTRAVARAFRRRHRDELGLVNRYGLAIFPKPLAVTGVSDQEMPERTYLFVVYDWYSGEAVMHMNMRREMVATIGDLVTDALAQPLEGTSNDPDLPG
jgi:hypothetical protein